MKEWLTASELADLGLPGLTLSKRQINRLARDENWASRRSEAGEPLARRRHGKLGGGGFEYNIAIVEGRFAPSQRIVIAPLSLDEASTSKKIRTDLPGSNIVYLPSDDAARLQRVSKKWSIPPELVVLHLLKQALVMAEVAP